MHGTRVSTELMTAICTPLEIDYSLDLEALEAHIEDQWQHGISGLLVAGTMGLMQLQSDKVYRDLVEHSVGISHGRGEIMVGVGDTSFARTRDRIQFAEQFAIDGVVALPPYLVKFSQEELVEYFRALADIAEKPLYLYDLPGLVGTRLAIQTIEILAKHPNIRGIKCSGAWEETRQLIDRAYSDFRVIPAQPHLVDHLVRVGISANLDGIFGIAPDLSVAIVRSAEAGNWSRAAELQQLLSKLLNLLRDKYTIYGGCEAILNARGIRCRLVPAPMQQLNEKQRNRLLEEPLVQRLLSGQACVVS